jgi:hypothetical protein
MPSPYQHPQAGDVATPPKYGVRASYVANIANLAAATTTCDTSVTLVEGDLVLLSEQTDHSEDGIYVVGAVASGVAPLTRFEKCLSAAGMPPGTQVYISEGTARGNLVYQLTTNAPIVVGTTALTFAAITQVATAPTITDFTNAAHDHGDADDGGVVVAAAVAPGTAYQVLRTNSGASASEWGSPMALAPAADLPAHVGNDIIPTTIVSGAVYDIPALDAASTITLPAAAADGTYCYIRGDGTKNDQTIQIRDATGPTNLTAAVGASKRLLAICVKAGGKWYANIHVSP